MLNIVKKLAKSFKKAVVRPKSSKVQISIPHREMPEQLPTITDTREELQTRMIQALRTGINAKLATFLKAVEDFDCVSCDSDAEHLIDTAEEFGFSEVADFDNDQLAALCAAVENFDISDTVKYEGVDIALEHINYLVYSVANGDYTFLPEVDNDESLGNELCAMLIESAGWKSRHNWLLDFVDWEEVGKVTRNDEGGSYTTRGYFQLGKLGL